MSLDSMRKQINKLMEEIESRQPPASDGEKYAFTMDLFTDEEQERLHTFLDQVEPRITNGPLGLRELTDDELDQLRLWLELAHALQAEDASAAARARRWLSLSTEQLIQAFLSLDLSFLPTNVNDPGPQIVEGHCIYHLNRAKYRYTVGMIERGIVSISFDDLRRWLDYAA